MNSIFGLIAQGSSHKHTRLDIGRKCVYSSTLKGPLSFPSGPLSWEMPSTAIAAANDEVSKF